MRSFASQGPPATAMVCRPLPRPAAHNHGARIIAAERRIERPQKALFVGAQEPAALIADPAPDRAAAEREGEERDDPHDIEQGGGAIQQRGKPGPPILSKRLRDVAQRSGHLFPGVRQRVEKHIHGAAPRDRGAPASSASSDGTFPVDSRAPSARISWERASTSRTISSGVPPDPSGASSRLCRREQQRRRRSGPWPATIPRWPRCSPRSRAPRPLVHRPGRKSAPGLAGPAEDGERRPPAWLRAASWAAAPRSRRAPSDDLSPPRAPPRRRLHPPAPRPQPAGRPPASRPASLNAWFSPSRVPLPEPSELRRHARSSPSGIRRLAAPTPRAGSAASAHAYRSRRERASRRCAVRRTG